MQFQFSEEQNELRNIIQRFLEKECPISATRSVMDSAAGHDAALWQKIGANGFLAAAIPEEFGGAGSGYLELCVVAEECGRALAAVPTVSTVYQAAELLQLAGSHAQKAKWLPQIAAGEAIGAIALQEGIGEMIPERVTAHVRGGKLSGGKSPVADGLEADFAIVMARDEAGGHSLFLADLRNEGVERTFIKTIDPSRKHAKLHFAETSVEPLGESGQGWRLLQQVRDRAAVLTAFEQVGGADRALRMARDYAMERYAFGRPIASFQAIKHTLADSYVANELARSNAYYGAWALSVGSDKLPIAAAGARVAATQAFQLASANNIQVHGGMGFTWEFDCHLFYRRSNFLALTLGGPALWESRLIERLHADMREGEKMI
ncbi:MULTISPECIES: acyl-CoA dehydrogenase family protein [unclassified Sphingomonas]|uniref:acyl-CoA dehydrogenase family protein n=1 Tax=unclassified Sphingomonas TaxID=196159 RepID=UPI0007016763|nr:MULTISPECIES: acyl-CoA dehydrogenase family protein [unclassified Sphingomonas]KQX18619.1 acyl-CoA dehydrogenase [Sphingomonas sp. Root1294]KQY72058.1 acyl-CoA dehydrogenase [Sphingomonas sp. Root50]KRB94673.1 acyl-CoA dehydrogenase [Sphingomonas sp. Root720]